MSEKKGTYYEIEQLSKRIDKLESTIREFYDRDWETIPTIGFHFFK